MKCLLSLAAMLALTAAAFSQHPIQKRVPPPGITIPDADRAELTKGAAALAGEIASLRAMGGTETLLPDIEIFHKAVDWALRYDEFYKVDQVENARALLVEGLSRARALKEKQAPWTTATGLVVRGFRSRIDGSVQPYGLVVPSTWAAGDRRPRRLDIFNHGRSDTLTELSFITERMNKPGELTPEDAFVLHPYGRFCNATRFAGETDVFEALAHVQASYPIDANRLVMTGFSMGGASVWHLTAHHASLWAAASPGAGFAETPIYTKALAPGKEAPPGWEQALWRLYNADAYAPNFFNCPTIAYAGEEDPQKAAGDIMEKALADAGIKLERLTGPKTGHKYHAETKKQLSGRLAEFATKGRDELPPRVRLATYTLRYPKQEWVEVTGLQKHWKRAEVDAEIVDEGTITLTTSNVTSLTLAFEGSAVPLDKTRPPRVLIDGVELIGPAVTNPWTAHFHRHSGVWRVGTAPGEGAPPLRKAHGLQGPIDDAFMDSFVFVTPTGKPLNDMIGEWVKAEIGRAVPQWRQVFRGDPRVITDREVTPEIIANANLVLWGDPSSNQLIRKLLPNLSTTWNASEVTIGEARGNGATTVPILIYPNPLNPKRYVVINSSFTFRQGSNASNATQTPKLPDWALVDVRTPPSEKSPGLVTNAGFFDESWNVASSQRRELPAAR